MYELLAILELKMMYVLVGCRGPPKWEFKSYFPFRRLFLCKKRNDTFGLMKKK